MYGAPTIVPFGMGYFTILITIIEGLRKEGEARLEKTLDSLHLHLTYASAMINNSAHALWDRLEHKSLNQQFINRLMEGMNCSPFEANAILDTVYEVFSPAMVSDEQQDLGQMYLLCTGIENSSSKPLEKAQMVRVRLTLDGGSEDTQVRRTDGIIALRQHRMERMAHQAYQQGGLLTLEDFAYRIFNCGMRTLIRDMKAFRKRSVVLPLRSTVKDMGRGISHRSLIVRYWLEGKEYDAISKVAHHSPRAIANYISKFKRCIWLANQGFDTHTIGFLVGLSPKLAAHYWKLYTDLPAAEHRQRQLQQVE